MKHTACRILLVLTTTVMCCFHAVAYSDHRGVATDSLEAVLRSSHAPQGKELLEAYLDLTRAYLTVDGKRCEEYARKALALTYDLEALNARETALYNLGLVAYGHDDNDKALEYFEWALGVTDSMKHDKRYSAADIDDNLSQLYGAIGNLYNIQDQLLLAIEYYQRALPIFERNGWLESQCILYYNVGELYLSMGNEAKAEQNYLLALEKGQQAGDSLMTALPRKGLTKIYLNQDYGKARQTLLQPYDYYHAHRDELPGDYAEMLTSLTRLHLMDGHQDMAKAKAYATEALTYVDKNLMTETRCDIFAAACETEMAQGHWQQALTYGLQAVRDDSVATFSDVGSYQQLAIIYTELGDKAQAKTYINKVREMLERFATESYQSGLSQMEVLYETEKKQAAIEQLTREKRLLALGSILAGVVLLLIALLFFLLWRSVRLSRRHALVKAKLEGERAERVRLARDLHDRLGGTLTALRLRLSANTEMHDDAGQVTCADKIALSLTDDAIREMRNVAHHLLPDSLSRYGLHTALRDYCQTMRNVSFAFIGDERHIANEETVYCIVYELVNNAVKHAEAQHIAVQLMVGDDFTAINVSDDGKGIVLPLSTTDDKSGLAGIHERVEAIGGKVDILTRPGEGTEINIELKNKPKDDEHR